jgi:hypothetical protein
MRRIIVIPLVALVLAMGTSLLPAVTAVAATCDNSAGATMDDGACGYIHPDDRVFAIIHQIAELENQVANLQITFGFTLALLVIIAFISAAQLTLSLVRRLEASKSKSHEQEVQEQA